MSSEDELRRIRRIEEFRTLQQWHHNETLRQQHWQQSENQIETMLSLEAAKGNPEAIRQLEARKNARIAAYYAQQQADREFAQVMGVVAVIAIVVGVVAYNFETLTSLFNQADKFVTNSLPKPSIDISCNNRSILNKTDWGPARFEIVFPSGCTPNKVRIVCQNDEQPPKIQSQSSGSSEKLYRITAPSRSCDVTAIQWQSAKTNTLKK